MKLNFQKLINKQVNQQQPFLVELSQEELELVRGGGWQTQGHCDTYYNLLANGRYAEANTYKQMYFS